MKRTAYLFLHSSLCLTMEGPVRILGNASVKLVIMDYAWVLKLGKVATAMLTAVPSSSAKLEPLGRGSTCVKS